MEAFMECQDCVPVSVKKCADCVSRLLEEIEHDTEAQVFDISEELIDVRFRLERGRWPTAGEFLAH
jgi:hypothetical protein